jgi:hypothetical protein
MKEIFCPNCGQAHKSEGKFCEYCGNNLEKVILQFKQDQMPIKYRSADRVQTYQQGPVSEPADRPERVARGRKSNSLSIFSLIFFGVAVILIILYNIGFLGFLGDMILYVIVGVFGFIFILLALISSAVNPRRRYRSSACYGPCYCSGNECDVCADCASGCDSCDCGDCGDCGGGCGDCGDCGGCDCTYGGVGFIIGVIELIFSKNKKQE